MMINMVDFNRYFAKYGKALSLPWEDACLKFSRPRMICDVHSDEIESREDELNQKKQSVGFVFWGTTRGGRKRTEDIISHSAVALDYDDIKRKPDEFLQHLESVLSKWNYMYYSTTKCTAKKLKIRIIIPLSREAYGIEYQALGRKIIELIGKDGVDAATLEESRAMGYCCRLYDAKYIYKAVTNREFLNTDEFLKENYIDYTNSDEWMRFDKEMDKSEICLNFNDGHVQIRTDNSENGNTVQVNLESGKTVQLDIESGKKKTKIKISNYKTVDGNINRKFDYELNPPRQGDVKSCFNAVFTCRDILDKCELYERVGNRYKYKKSSSLPAVCIINDAFCYSHHANSEDPLFGRWRTAYDIYLQLFTDENDIFNKRLTAAHNFALNSDRADKYKKLFYVDIDEENKSFFE